MEIEEIYIPDLTPTGLY